GQSLVFGADHPARAAGRIATLQTLGGSGALKVGADLLKRYLPDSQVWLSDPSWENHRFIFERAGFTVNTYPYYDEATGGLK
uniref:aminotransferase class I/II-fold pyridoxal phosphate-dependent enzyme n=1 Tax=Listeria monocytogenes TaxID=1639 RepID=UPI003F662BD7